MNKKPPRNPYLTKYVYCLVRTDLPPSYRAVQASHACMAAAFVYGEPGKTHPHLVLCGVPDEATLDKEFNRLKEAGVPVVGWYEDDLSNQLTAVASGPLAGEARNPLRYMKLLRD